MGVEHRPLHQGEAVEGPPGGKDQQLQQTGHVPAYLQPTLACWFVLLRLEETVWLCSRQTIPATPEAPHLTGRVGGSPPGEAGGLQVSSALTPVAALVIIFPSTGVFVEVSSLSVCLAKNLYSVVISLSWTSLS